jgi:chromate transporter
MDNASSNNEPKRPAPALGTVRVALLLGFIGMVAFGGPAAHVALMRREIVERRRWLEADQFSRMWAACNLIPGPSSTELAIFIGYRLAGWPGLLAAGACFIAPAMAIMLALAWVYTTYSNTQVLHAVLAGVRPVVVGIIAWAALDLGRKTLERRRLLFVAGAALILYVLGLNPLLILALMAAVALLLLQAKRAAVNSVIMLSTTAAGPHAERLVQLTLTFLKLGAISFGSGYVLFAFLQSDFVAGLHWLKPDQLVDAVAIGQVTPGPVFTTATFLGYVFAGVPGAVLATFAIFLPGFAMVPLLSRLVKLVDTQPLLRALLNGVNAAVVGLIIGVGYQLGVVSIQGWLTALVAVGAFLVVLWKPLASPAVVLGGALIGLAMAAYY